MDQNQKKGEGTVGENQSKSEEMNQNQRLEETVGEIGEEAGDNQRSREETIGENQNKNEEMNQNQRHEETVGEIGEETGDKQRSREENVDQNQSQSEEMNQNQRRGEEIDDNQRSGEETVDESQNKSDEMNQFQKSGEETVGENQGTVEEIGENQNSDEEMDKNQRTGGKIVREDYNSGEETEYQSNGEEDKDYEISDDDEWVGGKRCPVSDPVLPHDLSCRKGAKTSQKCKVCKKRGTSQRQLGRGFKYFHYYCAICRVEFHRHCRWFLDKLIHPYHPQHPLTLTWTYEISSLQINPSSLIFNQCSWCAKDHGNLFYRCTICHFSLDYDCAIKTPPLTIQNPKSHHHPLSLFPRPASFPCNACGLIDVEDPSYACYQCNYFVHHSCIGLPRVIKITRHPHQLFHTPNYVLTKASTCRVCYKDVDIRYGQYSCNHGDCSYVAHSKCATHEKVWDGKEIEWEPEESDEAEDIVAPYKSVGDGLIEHFSHHHHHLKLEKYDGSRDTGKQCVACLRYIISSHEDFYNCIECEFFLHEVCANLPRKLDHGLHIHSLFLDPYPLKGEILVCDVCDQRLSCWMYKCEKEELVFVIDVNCILVPECFTHGSHAEHPMFMCTTYGTEDWFECQCCKEESSRHRLKCTECDFVLCYGCVTVPNKVYYKYDEHPLSICYGESGDVNGVYWCELCEEKLEPKDWFYTNNDGATIHVRCVLGDSALVKPGHSYNITIRHKKIKIEVVGNCISRPICSNCQRRCPHTVYIRAYLIDGTTNFNFCSFVCVF